MTTNLHRMASFTLVLVLGLLFGACEHAGTEDEPLVCNTAFNAGDYPASTISFEDDIKPILANYGCNSQFCHGADTPPSNFSVRTATSILGPGNEAEQLGVCNVTRGDPENSYIIRKLRGDAGIIGGRMPEGGGQIDDADFQVIRQWILEGAPNN
ncbi:MAG: hypothetical protein SH809_08110 [Rhodothermales bacterium]|nr:hypothetical protein [Rhodothermales bacterium]